MPKIEEQVFVRMFVEQFSQCLVNILIGLSKLTIGDKIHTCVASPWHTKTSYNNKRAANFFGCVSWIPAD